jgi:acyl CoA:acetate/3-ketoacid CoA transferase alpha subunit
MSRRIARLLVTTIAVGFIVVGTGCATDDEIFKLRVEAKEAKGAADRAEVAAHKADSAANASARLSAEALNAAQAAYACCRANTERRTRAESKLGS